MAGKDVPDHVSRTVGKEAQRNNILAVKIIADIVKTTLGPKGMDKMLVDAAGNMTITNDGVTILEEMELDHPAARLIVDIAKSQEHEVGDGTTTVALLAGTLLERAEHLLERRIHPTVIIRGFQRAAEKACELARELSKEVSSREMLEQIAITAMTGKGAEGNREQFAKLIVSAIDQISRGKEVELDDVMIQKIPGSHTEQSALIPGVVIEKDVAHPDMPRSMADARIALVDFPLEVRTPETQTAVSVSNPEQLRQFLESEERFLKDLVSRIVTSGARVVFCQKGIDDVAQYYLAREGIMAFRRIPRSYMERLSKATGAKIVSNSAELGAPHLGVAHVEIIRQGNEAYTYVRASNPRAVTLVVYGSTTHGADETERALRDGLGVVAAAVRDGRVVPGGGAIEISLSKKLREFARTLSGREQLAVDEFALALEAVPETLAENAGLDPIEIITELKKRHEAGRGLDGINLLTDTIEDCFAAGIVEPLRVKTHAISAATEVATLILRIDDVLISSGKKQKQESPLEGLD